MIRLRTFVLLSSVLVVVFALFFSWMQMKRVLEKGALTLEEKEFDHISQVVRSAIEIKKSELRNYTRIVRSNNDLSSTYIIAKESGDVELLDSKLKGIQDDLHFDFSELLTQRGQSIHSARLPLTSEALKRILREKEGIFSSEIRGQPVLVSFSPLKLYGEHIAIVVLGYFLDGQISKDLSRFTGADVVFKTPETRASHAPKLVDLAQNRLSFDVDGTLPDNLWATISLKANPVDSFWTPLSGQLIFSGVITLAILLISLYFLLEFGFIRSFRAFVEEINKTSQNIGRGEPREISTISSRIFENNLLFRACANLVSNLIAYQKRMKEQVLLEEAAEKQKALGELAQQVAHDIRSPLSALEVATDTVTEIPEENRLLIRGAVSRIQDIANNLLARRKEIERGNSGKILSHPDNLSVQLLSCLIESIVSEKRLQLRQRLDLQIETKLDPSAYGLFASVQPATLKTVISNLIDNSAEALDKGGNVTVHLQDRNDQIELSIEDNGKGVPSDLLPQLGQRGRSFNKDNGSGLGLYHPEGSPHTPGVNSSTELPAGSRK